jgi:hypothetical protein
LFLLKQFFGGQVVSSIDKDTATNYEEKLENAGNGNYQKEYGPRFYKNCLEIKAWYKECQYNEVNDVGNWYDQKIYQNKCKKDCR